MAKSPQDDMSDVNKSSAAGRESQFTGRDNPSSFGREAQAAGREAQAGMRDTGSAARHAQSAAAQFASMTILQPYTELLQEMESAHHQWANGMRATIERTIELASRINEAMIAEARRTTDLMFRTYEADIAAQTSLAREMPQRASSALRQRSEAAE